MACQCMKGCEVKPPTWYSRPEDAGIAGTCPTASLRQCNAIFTTASAKLTASSATATLTFDVSASNFSRFRPVGIKFEVSDLAGGGAEYLARDVVFTALNYQGTNYKLDSNGTPLSVYSVEAPQALSCVHLGDLYPGGQDPSVSVALVATGSTATYVVTAMMFGFAIRGAGGSRGPTGSAVVP